MGEENTKAQGDSTNPGFSSGGVDWSGTNNPNTPTPAASEAGSGESGSAGNAESSSQANPTAATPAAKGVETDAPPASSQDADSADSSAGADEDAPEDVRNPEKFYRAQAEKFERLLKDAEEKAKALENRVNTLEAAQREKVESAIAETKRGYEEAKAALKAQAEDAAADALRWSAIAKHGLSPDDVDFLTAKTPEGVERQAARLAERVAAKRADDAKAARRTETPANPGGDNPPDGSWVNRRWNSGTFGHGGVVWGADSD